VHDHNFYGGASMLRCLAVCVLVLTGSLLAAQAAAAQALSPKLAAKAKGFATESPQPCTPSAIRLAYDHQVWPDVRGCQEPAVSGYIEELFKLKPVTAYDDKPVPSSGPETIIDQSPQAGTAVEGVTTFTLHLASPQAQSSQEANSSQANGGQSSAPSSNKGPDQPTLTRVRPPPPPTWLDRIRGLLSRQPWLWALPVLVVAGLLGLKIVTPTPRPVSLPGAPRVDVKLARQDSVLRFANPRRAVLAAPAFDWELVPSAPRLGGPIEIVAQYATERMPP
jgi:hypothetical protein